MHRPNQSHTLHHTMLPPPPGSDSTPTSTRGRRHLLPPPPPTSPASEPATLGARAHTHSHASLTSFPAPGLAGYAGTQPGRRGLGTRECARPAPSRGPPRSPRLPAGEGEDTATPPPPRHTTSVAVAPCPNPRPVPPHVRGRPLHSPEILRALQAHPPPPRLPAKPLWVSQAPRSGPAAPRVLAAAAIFLSSGSSSLGGGVGVSEARGRERGKLLSPLLWPVGRRDTPTREGGGGGRREGGGGKEEGEAEEGSGGPSREISVAPVPPGDFCLSVALPFGIG